MHAIKINILTIDRHISRDCRVDKITFSDAWFKFSTFRANEITVYFCAQENIQAFACSERIRATGSVTSVNAPDRIRSESVYIFKGDKSSFN
jgi:hypothetical protein